MTKPALALPLAAALMAVPGIAPAQTMLKWAHVYETSEPYHTCAVAASDLLMEATGDRYGIEVFPASSLGKEVDINEGLGFGTVDIIYTGQLFAGRAYGPIAIGGAPFMFRDYAHWDAFRNSDLFDELSQGYTDASGNHIVAMTYYGARNVTSNKPVLTPADMEGMKIRVPNAPLYMMFPEAVGANPAPIAFAEVYLALQQGTVDAQENPLPTIQAKKFHEVQSDINLTEHITDALLTIVGGPTWDAMDEADREIAVGRRGPDRRMRHRPDHPGRGRAGRVVPRAGRQRQRGRPRPVHRSGAGRPQRPHGDLGPGDLRPPSGDRVMPSPAAFVRSPPGHVRAVGRHDGP